MSKMGYERAVVEVFDTKAMEQLVALAASYYSRDPGCSHRNTEPVCHNRRK